MVHHSQKSLPESTAACNREQDFHVALSILAKKGLESRFRMLLQVPKHRAQTANSNFHDAEDVSLGVVRRA